MKTTTNTFVIKKKDAMEFLVLGKSPESLLLDPRKTSTTPHLYDATWIGAPLGVLDVVEEMYGNIEWEILPITVSIETHPTISASVRHSTSNTLTAEEWEKLHGQ